MLLRSLWVLLFGTPCLLLSVYLTYLLSYLLTYFYSFVTHFFLKEILNFSITGWVPWEADSEVEFSAQDVYQGVIFKGWEGSKRPKEKLSGV